MDEIEEAKNEVIAALERLFASDTYAVMEGTYIDIHRFDQPDFFEAWDRYVQVRDSEAT